jgi:multicomponent Na+:H+ antiporter subunit D
VVLGLGLGTPLGMLGGLFHLFNHSVFKSLLFLNSGAIEYAVGTRSLKEMGGLKEKMPVTANTSLVASLAIAGIPPFNGFWSKLVIIIAAVQADRPGCAAFAVLASILTLASFMKVQGYAFFGELRARLKKTVEVPALMRYAMIALALICLLSGALLIPAASKGFLGAAVDALARGTEYANIVLGTSK